MPRRNTVTESNRVGGRGYGLSLLIDISVPVALYLVLHFAFGIGDFTALVTATVVAGACTVFGTIRRRRLDGIGLLVIVELLLSLGFVLLVHSPRVLLFKPVVLIGLGAGYGLYTCFTSRPIGFYSLMPFVTKGNARRAERYEATCDADPKMCAKLKIMTAAWGVAFLVDAAVRLYFSLTASITDTVLRPQMIELALLGLAVVVTVTQVPYVKTTMEKVLDSDEKAQATET